MIPYAKLPLTYRTACPFTYSKDQDDGRIFHAVILCIEYILYPIIPAACCGAYQHVAARNAVR